MSLDHVIVEARGPVVKTLTSLNALGFARLAPTISAG